MKSGSRDPFTKHASPIMPPLVAAAIAKRNSGFAVGATTLALGK